MRDSVGALRQRGHDTDDLIARGRITLHANCIREHPYCVPRAAARAG